MYSHTGRPSSPPEKSCSAPLSCRLSTRCAACGCSWNRSTTRSCSAGSLTWTLMTPCGAAHRHGGAGSGDHNDRASSCGETNHTRRGQALRHHGVHRGPSKNGSHPARRAEHGEPTVGDRQVRDVSSELLDQPECSKTGRGGLRLDDDDRTFRMTRYVGAEKVAWPFALTAASNLARMRNLLITG